MRTTLSRRASAAAALTTAALSALTLGAATAHTAIESMSAQLTVSPFIAGTSSNVAVFGKVAMTKAEAQQLINSGHRVALRLWGDDPSSDDLIMGPYYATLVATDSGLEFHKVVLDIRNGYLNEDNSIFDDHDELYVGARLVTSSGSTVRSAETNRQYGYF